MVTIKISELQDISESTTSDLVNTKDLANLHELETRSIHGGDCYYAGKKYTPGSVKTMSGVKKICDGRFLRPDEWVNA